jgi:hypothetical protein
MINQQDPQQSTSEKIINAPQQDPQQQQQENQQQTTQQKLSNNQMDQDSQALKQQMQRQIQEEAQQEKQFQQSVMNNTDVEQMHQELLEQGYNLTDTSFNAESNNSGSFNFTYENKVGQTASMNGKMKNGEITFLQSLTAEERQKMLETLNQSADFKNYEEKLDQEGFNQTDILFSQQENTTTVDLTYKNKNNETAVIHAEFEDDQLKKVQLEKQDKIPWFFWLVVIFITVTILLLIIYKWFINRKNDNKNLEKTILIKQFDYQTEAKRLILEAIRDFDQGLLKNAYGKTGQSLRLFLSYHHGLNCELTNQEIITLLKKLNNPHENIKQCLDLCSQVEFAKYKANKIDFSKIIKIARSIIT